MPRIPNIRPTTIYWLVDVRPETIVSHPDGKPFYCGKTVVKPQKRLKDHRFDALKHPKRPIAKRLSECGEFVRMDTVDVVTATENWRERERFWIATIRHFYPDCVNVSAGGDGVPGLVHTCETRSRISAAKKGCFVSAESRAKRSVTQKGRVFSDEHRSKIRAARRGQKFSNEHRLKMSEAHKGKTLSAKVRSKIGAANKGRVLSPETRAKMKAAWVIRKGGTPEMVAGCAD